MPSFYRRRADRRATAPVFACVLILLGTSRPPDASGQAVEAPARQVTLFGVIASPSDRAIDPKLAKIAPQLRKLLPDHGFRLLDVQSKRLTKGQTVVCKLQDGRTSEVTLLQPSDADGKVRVRCALLLDQSLERETLVTTPPNQLFFCDEALKGGDKLLIGVGAR